VAYQDLGVVLVGHYAGLSGGEEGACHHSINDIAALRAVPNLAVLVAASDVDVRPLLRSAVDRGRPVYLRLSRNPSPTAPAPDRGSLVDGWRYWGADRPEVVIVVAGPLLRAALNATSRIEEKVGVLNVVSVKPFPSYALDEVSANARAVVTVEEHAAIGGLGSAVCELASRNRGAVCHRIGLADVFTVSGGHEQLLQFYGLTAERIARTVRSLVREI
jgi:transketolase